VKICARGLAKIAYSRRVPLSATIQRARQRLGALLVKTRRGKSPDSRA